MSKETKPRSPERVHKLGEHEAKTTIELSDAERTRERELALKLMADQERLEGELAKWKKKYKAEIDSAKQKIREARDAADTGIREIAIVIETFITKSNEVVQIRQDTGEQVGSARKARPDELEERDEAAQRDMFKDQDDDGFGSAH